MIFSESNHHLYMFLLFVCLFVCFFFFFQETFISMKTNNNRDQCVKPKHSRKLLKRRIFIRSSNVRSIWHGRDSVVLWGLHRCGRVKFTLLLLFVWRFKRSCTRDLTGGAWWLASWSLHRLNKKRNLSVMTEQFSWLEIKLLLLFLCFAIVTLILKATFRPAWCKETQTSLVVF